MSDTISNIGKNHLIIFFIRTGDNVVVSVNRCLHNTIFFGFNHDANIGDSGYNSRKIKQINLNESS